MPKLQVGNRLCGKSKRHMGKIGLTLRVLKESRQHTYEVQWTNGAVDIVSARSISVDPASSRFEYGVASEGSTFFELLGSADDHNQDNVVCESSSSDGEKGEDDAVDSVENSESEGDDTVTAHGRLWVSCDAILVDQATQFSSRATTFLWPAYLQLGEPTLVKYFYLMYPMSTLQETIRITNANLSKKAFRSIGPGDLFRWIGIRLAMAVEPRRGPIRDYWDTEYKEGYVNTAANYAARFQMSRHCFEQVMYALALSDNSQSDDPWNPIRPLKGV